MMSKASGEGRGRSRCALPLLLPLLFFSSFSFGASSLDVVTGRYLCNSPGATWQAINFPSPGCATAPSASSFCGSAGFYSTEFSCSTVTCSLPSNATEVSGSTWSQYFAAGSYCDPSSNCVESSAVAGAGEYIVASGAACFPKSVPATAPVVSSSTPNAPPPPGSCPVGYYVADASACVCTNGSGSYVQVYGASVISSCNGGHSTAPTLSPVAPVTSNGVTSCPAGSSSVSSGSSTSCYTVVIPPSINSSSSGTTSGGAGGGSSFHLVAPVTSSNGQLICQSGQSSIMGSSGSLECIASGSGTAPTSSTGSGTAPTGSTSSAPSYPTSISMPSLPSFSVTKVALGTIPGAQESTSETCPAPVTFSVMGHTFSITFTYACTLAGQVRPIVIGVFSLASLLLLVK
ncbi:MAG: virulence factor TspB C-terminal domain-related protein [Acidithiobacillus sp.]